MSNFYCNKMNKIKSFLAILIPAFHSFLIFHASTVNCKINFALPIVHPKEMLGFNNSSKWSLSCMVTHYIIFLSTILIILVPSLVNGSCQTRCLPMKADGSQQSCSEAYGIPQRSVQNPITFGACVPSNKRDKWGGNFIECCSDKASIKVTEKKRKLDGILMRINGASDGEFPHQIHLEFKVPGVGVLGCGGTIYNKRWIVTAGHCVRPIKPVPTNVDVSPGSLTIIAGLTNLLDDKNPRYRYPVERVIPHPQYDNTDIPKGFDIALLKLGKDLDFSDPNIRALKMAPPSFETDSKEKTVVMGWGKTLTGETIQWLLKEQGSIRTGEECAEMRFADKVKEVRSTAREDLIKLYPNNWEGEQGQLNLEKSIDDSIKQALPSLLADQTPLQSHLCLAGGNDSFTVGEGDSGGPAVCNDPGNFNNPVLCGVASFKDGKCEKSVCSIPSVYTRISSYHNWIKETIKEEQNDQLLNLNLFGKKAKSIKEWEVNIQGSKINCDGVLIDQDRILTTAQCVKDNDIQSITAGPGKRSLTLKRVSFKKGTFTQIKLPSYLSKTFGSDLFNHDDIAIIFLASPAKARTTLELPPANYKGPSEGSAVERARRLSDGQIMKRKYLIVDMKECLESYNLLGAKGVAPDENQMCAVVDYSGGSQCDRQLGSPLICEDKYICGITSYRACQYSLPNIFSHIASHLDWINQQN